MALPPLGLASRLASIGTVNSGVYTGVDPGDRRCNTAEPARTEMKRCAFRHWFLGASLLLAPLIGCVDSSPKQSAVVPVGSAASNPPVVVVEAAPPPEPMSNAEVPEATAAPVSILRPPPENLPVRGAALEVVKLANSGVEEGVMLAFVTNSSSMFNLSAEGIIYLKDIGVSDLVVAAIVEHDQALRTALAASFSAPASPSSQPAPAESVAPQPASTEAAPVAEAQPAPAEASQTPFYSDLAPYGSWVYLNNYGYCWQPTVVVVNRGWQPYFDCGQWVYTDCGWYWRSGYSWGWAPFHYGRWFRHVSLGWCWSPGTVWGPAWVSWRYGGDYCGWAPLPPAAGFSFGIGLTFGGAPLAPYGTCGLGWSTYRFVGWGDFCRANYTGCYLPPQQAYQVYNQTIVVNNIKVENNRVVNRGVPVDRVERATRAPVREVALRDMDRPASRSARAERFEENGRTLAVYRPRVAGDAAGRQRGESETRARPGSTAQTEAGQARAVAPRPGTPSSTARPADPVANRSPGRPPETAGAEAAQSRATARPAGTVITTTPQPAEAVTSQPARIQEQAARPSLTPRTEPAQARPAPRPAGTVITASRPPEPAAGLPNGVSEPVQRPAATSPAAPAARPSPIVIRAPSPTPTRESVRPAPSLNRESTARPSIVAPQLAAPSTPQRPATTRPDNPWSTPAPASRPGVVIRETPRPNPALSTPPRMAQVAPQPTVTASRPVVPAFQPRPAEVPRNPAPAVSRPAYTPPPQSIPPPQRPAAAPSAPTYSAPAAPTPSAPSGGRPAAGARPSPGGNTPRGPAPRT